jgi:putative ABC transport system ATP-binding protein
LDGEEISRVSAEDLALIRNAKIGFVFQNFNLLPRMTALRNVELPMLYAGISKIQRHEQAREALEKVGMQDRLDHRPAELSGGQNQRVAIARSLVNRPKILLADEPTGNLDSRTSEEIMFIFSQLHQEGTTIVLVTHEYDIARHSQRIIHFYDGAIAREEQPFSSAAKKPEGGHNQ